MCIRINRMPAGQDFQYRKVENVREDNQKKKKDDQQKKKKKKDEKMESIFSSLADSLGQEEEY